jgi:hypothetical protein
LRREATRGFRGMLIGECYERAQREREGETKKDYDELGSEK